ncbi:MAG TPA: DUF5668 domain-containing protein [Longilinea sp.]|nr:DUF5668 domain-containing protein [Longilinea sp.]
MRRNRLFWGAIVLLAGVLLLMNTLNIFTFNFWPVFWALLLILAGVWFLLGPRLFKHDFSEEKVSIPLEGASEVDIRIDHGAGRLSVNSASLPVEILNGTVTGGFEREISRNGSIVSLNLSMAKDSMLIPFPNIDFKGFLWNLTINRDLPLRLELHTGAGETVLALTDAMVKQLRIETGASSTRVALPSHASLTRVIAKAGMAALEFNVPQGVAARISLRTGISGNKIDTSRFPQNGEFYQSPDFDSAANKVDIEIEAGMGGIEVR